MHNQRNPLAKVHGLGSAKNGTHHWWMQRVTAIANIPLMLWFVVSMAHSAVADYATLVAWIQQPTVAVLLILLVANVTFHMRLGLQVALEDYIFDHGNRIAAMLIVTFVTVALAALGIFSILKISLGG